MAHIVIVGGGFAGYWSAARAARSIKQFGAQGINVTLVSADSYLTLRPRLYEGTLAGTRLPLDPLLKPIKVSRVEGVATAVQPEARCVLISTVTGELRLPYDQLVLAVGSRLCRPDIPGLRTHGFSVDSYAEAEALAAHLAALSSRPATAERFTAVVAGSGLTGLETVTTLVDRLIKAAGSAALVRVVLVERGDHVAPLLGDEPRRVVERALQELGVQVRTGTSVAAVAPDGVTLSTGEFIPAATTVWTAGMRANPLAASLSVALDPLGRVPVDKALRVVSLPGIFAAGDVARAMADEMHVAPMSCSHAMPQGKVAGRNAVLAVLGRPLVTYRQRTDMTCVDLGRAGALIMGNRAQKVRLKGWLAKPAKWLITRQIIMPIHSAR